MTGIFTQKDIKRVRSIVGAFPLGTEFSILRMQGGSTNFYGAIKTEDGVEEKQNRQSVFEIGSITKVLTSTVLAQMVVEDIVDLDASIETALGFPLKDNANISFKQLATHRAGLQGLPGFSFRDNLEVYFGRNEDPYRIFDENKLLTYMRDELRQKRAGKFSYSNLGAGLLGYLLAKQANQSYDRLLKTRIFQPLGMLDSTTNWKEVEGKLVGGLNRKGKPTSNWNLNILAGAGQVLSSVESLAKFLKANMRDDEVLDFQKQLMTEGGGQPMGLGWLLMGDIKDKRKTLHFHNGGTGGYRSSMVANFEQGHAVVVLSNVSALSLAKANRIDGLAFYLLKNT